MFPFSNLRYPSGIRFYIKGKLVGSIVKTKNQFHENEMYVKSLPDFPMFIVVSIIPDDMEQPDPIYSKVTVRMHLYKVRYIMWEDRHKQDLFVQQDSRASSIIFILIFASIGCLGVGWLFQEHKHMEDDYILLDDENTVVNENDSIDSLNLSTSTNT